MTKNKENFFVIFKIKLNKEIKSSIFLSLEGKEGNEKFEFQSLKKGQINFIIQPCEVFWAILVRERIT